MALVLKPKAPHVIGVMCFCGVIWRAKNDFIIFFRKFHMVQKIVDMIKYTKDS